MDNNNNNNNDFNNNYYYYFIFLSIITILFCFEVNMFTKYRFGVSVQCMMEF